MRYVTIFFLERVECAVVIGGPCHGTTYMKYSHRYHEAEWNFIVAFNSFSMKQVHHTHFTIILEANFPES